MSALARILHSTHKQVEAFLGGELPHPALHEHLLDVGTTPSFTFHHSPPGPLNHHPTPAITIVSIRRRLLDAVDVLCAADVGQAKRVSRNSAHTGRCFHSFGEARSRFPTGEQLDRSEVESTNT